MKERLYMSEQAGSRESVVPGLTEKSPPSYAEYGDIFMAETTVEQHPGAEVVKAETQAAEEKSGHVNWDTMDPEKKKDIEDKINRYNGRWEDLIKDENETVHIIELARAMQAAGVTLEQFLKDRKFYERNLQLFKRKDKKEEEKAKKTIKKWEEYFSKIDKENGNSLATAELNSKWYLVHTLAISANLSPYQFAGLYNWESFFSVKKPETGGSLKQLLVEIVKEHVLDVITGAFVDDPNLTSAENKKRRQAFARVLWGGTNQKRKEVAIKNGQKDAISVDELSVQDKAIEIGIAPARLKRGQEGVQREIENPVEVFNNASDKLENEARMEKVKTLILDILGEQEADKQINFTKEQIDEFIAIHKIGRVYELTGSEVSEKAKKLHIWLEKHAGINDKNVRKLLVRKIIEKGLAGVGRQDRSTEGGLTDEQARNVESIIRLMESSGFILDTNNPLIMSQLEKIVREEIPAGKTIQHEDVSRVINMMLPRINRDLKNLSEAQQITEEEKSRRVKAWDKWIEVSREDILRLPDEGRRQFHRDVQWARANHLTPEQAGIRFSRYSRMGNFGRDYNPEDKPEEVTSADAPKAPMSEREKELFEKEWKRFGENLRIAGIDPESEEIQRQIRQAREGGIFPSEFEFNMPHVGREDREQMEDVSDEWEYLAKIRYESGNPLTPEELRMMANMGSKGEYPPESMYPSGSSGGGGGGADNLATPLVEGGGRRRRRKRNEGSTGLVQLENGERVQGRLTMWEEIVEFMNGRGQIYANNEGYINSDNDSQNRNARKAEVRFGLEEQLFENRTPDNIEDIAWQIGRSAPDKYGVTGKHPVLEVVYRTNIVRNGKEIKAGSRVRIEEDMYNEEIAVSRVNQGNFIRWLRDRMLTLHGDNPDDPLDYEAQISIDKSFRPFYFSEARKNTQKYFRSEFRAREHQRLKSSIAKETDPEKIRQLKRQLADLPPIVMENLAEYGFKQETWAYGVDRDNNLNYRFRSGNKEEFVKMMMEKLSRSAFTKTAWGKSLMEWILTWDQNFGEGDHKLGAAINGAYMIYYNLTDTFKLYQMLGSKSALLSEDGLKRSRDEAAGIYDEDGNVTKEYGLQQEGRDGLTEDKAKADAARKAYLSDKSIHALFRYNEKEKKSMQEASGGQLRFEEAEVDADGNPQWKEIDQNGNELINEWRYIKTLNINQSPQFDTRIENVVHTAIKRDIARIFDLTIPDENDEDKKVRDVLNVSFAQNFAHLMTNWTGVQARNNQSAAGYDAWVALQKTRTYRLKYAANKRAEAFGNPHTMHMFKGLITDVMAGIRTETRISEDEISEEGSRYSNRTKKSYKSPHEVMEEMYDAWVRGGSQEEITQRYLEKSGQLLFPANTLKYFANDQIMRGMGIYDQIIDAQEIKLEKFTKIDPWKGITFERDQFQSAVQEKFLKPMRYMLSTWSQTDFAQMIRTNVSDGANTDWREMSLAESMFGREMLDVPEFWEEVSEGTPGAKKYETRDKDGNYKFTWRIPHKISGKEVNDNRTQLIKQMAKMRIAAELYEHVDLHSTDPRYNFIYYETIIQALEALPGGVLGDETDMKRSRTKVDKRHRYFSPEDIEWIRKKSHTEQWRTVGQAILFDSIGKGLWGGIADAFKISFKHITGDLK